MNGAPEPAGVLRALVEIWHELPEVMGSDWSSLRDELQRLMEGLRAAERLDEQQTVAAQLALELSKYPDAQGLFQRALGGMQATGAGPASPRSEVRGRRSELRVIEEATEAAAPPRSVRTRGGIATGPVATRKLGAVPLTTSFQHYASRLDGYARPSTLTRYTDIECPRRVWIGQRRVQVSVRLTTKPSALSAVSEPVALRRDHPVTVEIEAPGFHLEGAPWREMTVPEERDSDPVVFHLAPKVVGDTRVRLLFRQGRVDLGAVTVAVEVTSYEVTYEAAAHEGPPLSWDTGAQPADLVLQITAYHPPHVAPVLQMTLWEDEQPRRFQPIPLKARPDIHVQQYYRQLTGLTRNIDVYSDLRLRRPDAVIEEQAWIERAGVDRRVKAFGQRLWKDLIPPDFKRYYAGRRDQWGDRSLLVVSDEPYLPWELIWPYAAGDGKWEEEMPWCARFRMTRWLRCDRHETDNRTPPARLRLGSMAVVAPTDNNLVSTKEERAKLLELIGEGILGKSSPSSARWEAVMDVLEGGQYDWFHVAAHGKFPCASPDEDAAVWLENGEALTPQHLVGPKIEGHLGRVRPGFFLNACELGRLAYGLTQQAGWAWRLISAGAGLFVAPQWEIADESAVKFAAAFYQALCAGQTVGAAALKARFAARKSGDPTWLTYCVYAHPNARVDVG